jgi:hypothetical protein
MGDWRKMPGLEELRRRVKVLEEVLRKEAVDQRERPEMSHTDVKTTARPSDRCRSGKIRAVMNRLEAAVEMPL